MPEELHPRPSEAPAQPSAPPARAFAQGHGRLAGLALAVVLAIAGVVGYLHFSRPAVPVSTPANPANLDPLLRQYVDERVAWVRESPRDPMRHATLGLVFAANGLWSEARLAFENAAQLDPRQPLAWLYLAICHQELGQPDRAIALLRDVTGRFPEFAPGFYRLGDYALRLGALDEAERAFTRLTELAEAEWRGFSGLGEIKLRRGHPEAAVPFLEKALLIDPLAKPVHALLGQAYQQLGRSEEAQRELALGLNASHYPMPDPWSEQARQHMRLPFDLIEMAQGHLRSGAPAQAVHILEKAVLFHPDNPGMLVTLANACTLAGEPEKARPLLDRLLQADPSSAPAYVALSGCDLAVGEVERALSNANRAISVGSTQPEPYLAKANALLNLNRDPEAVTALEMAHRCDSNNAQILLDLGDVRLRNLGQVTEALADYRKAAAADPLFVPAHLRVAEISMQLGDRASAMASLEAARKLAPKDLSIARVLERLKQEAAR